MPGPKVSLEFFQRVGGGAGAVGSHPGYVRLLNELPKCQTFAVEAVQRMTAVGHVTWGVDLDKVSLMVCNIRHDRNNRH